MTRSWIFFHCRASPSTMWRKVVELSVHWIESQGLRNSFACRMGSGSNPRGCNRATCVLVVETSGSGHEGASVSSSAGFSSYSAAFCTGTSTASLSSVSAIEILLAVLEAPFRDEFACTEPPEREMFSCTDSCDEGMHNAGEPWVRRTVEFEQDAMPETGTAFEDHVRREANDASPQLLPTS